MARCARFELLLFLFSAFCFCFLLSVFS